MLERVEKTLRDECLIDPTDPVVIGVSGGPDSLGLLYALHHLGGKLIVAHLNHGIRPEADEDADFVRRAAHDLGVNHYSDHQDTLLYAEEHGLAIEEAARKLRYQFLFSIAEKENAQAVVVGHTADDQVETVLMHLLRGAGLSGLRGMGARIVLPSWHERIPLVRPLLDVWRSEVLAYCEEKHLEPRFDRSNLDTTYFRNRLRHELIPNLATYNPRIRQIIWKMAETLRTDFEVVENAIVEVWDVCVTVVAEGYVELSRESFSQQPVGIQRGIARRAMGILRPGLRDIDFSAVERVLTFVRTPPSTQQGDLIAGMRIQCEGDKFWIADWDAEISALDFPQVDGKEIKVKVPGNFPIKEPWVLSLEIFPAEGDLIREAMNNQNPFTGYFDADVFTSEGVVRANRPGDRFTPLGMGEHSIKLADFFINVKLPQRARKAWPLVCVQNQIAWVPGYRISHSFSISSDTKKIVKLHLYNKTAQNPKGN